MAQYPPQNHPNGPNQFLGAKNTVIRGGHFTAAVYSNTSTNGGAVHGQTLRSWYRGFID